MRRKTERFDFCLTDYVDVGIIRMVLVAAKYKTSDTEVDINNRMLTEFNLLTSTEGVSDALYYDLDGLMIKTIKICHLDVVYWYNCIGKRGKPRLYHFK